MANTGRALTRSVSQSFQDNARNRPNSGNSFKNRTNHDVNRQARYPPLPIREHASMYEYSRRRTEFTNKCQIACCNRCMHPRK